MRDFDDDEIQTKQNRLAEFLDRHKLDGVILWNRNNFAWISGGADNHIANNSPAGVAAIYATKDSRVCLANTIESPRMRAEELVGRGIETITFPWFDRAAQAKTVRELIGDKKVASDDDDFGLNLQKLPADFAKLRWQLTPAEIARYREGGKRASGAIEKTCRALKAGMTEFEIAGLLDKNTRDAGTVPVVTLVSSDDRLPKFRHPIPTAAKANRHAMLVLCAEFRGLISCLTRFVHFGPMPDELKKKQRAICNIDAAINFATNPGRTLGEVFSDIQKAYAREGYADQWQLHHQGGSTGYTGREVFATPGSDVKVLKNQAFAWNPSIVGAKCEDTVLISGNGIEVLTAQSESWPKVIGKAGNQTLVRADVLQI